MSRVFKSRVAMPRVSFRALKSVPAFPFRRFAVSVALAGLAVLCAGCASNQSAYGPQARVGAPVPAPQQWAARVEIEDDGLPAQLAPRHRRPVADDPSEPWSPNYGTAPGGSKALRSDEDQPSPQPKSRRGAATVAGNGLPAPSPARPIASSRPPTRLSTMDEDAIIRRAIAEHEMRRGE